MAPCRLPGLSPRRRGRGDCSSSELRSRPYSPPRPRTRWCSRPASETCAPLSWSRLGFGGWPGVIFLLFCAARAAVDVSPVFCAHCVWYVLLSHVRILLRRAPHWFLRRRHPSHACAGDRASLLCNIGSGVLVQDIVAGACGDITADRAHHPISRSNNGNAYQHGQL